jgi:hypothetical protein
MVSWSFWKNQLLRDLSFLALLILSIYKFFILMGNNDKLKNTLKVLSQ